MGLSAEFAEDEEEVRQWKAFAEKMETDRPSLELDKAVNVLREFLCPALDAARFTGEEFEQLWPPGGPWVRPPD